MNNAYLIKQLEDKPLSHFSYAVISNKKMVLIDPARNPQPYYDLAKQQDAVIVGVIETHPHADFVSSHLEIHRSTKATIYSSKLTAAEYPHSTFDDGDKLQLGNVVLKAINTPGHSPDSICILLENAGKDEAVFTGDTLFIGDCGRPDLRENAGNITASRDSLAKDMYCSLHEKLLLLNDNVVVYPAHGAGTLCGKALKEANESTIGEERISNWSLQDMTEQDFVKELVTDQPNMPKYFGFDVAINRKGADEHASSISKVKRIKTITITNAKQLDRNMLVIDARPNRQYQQGHLPNAFNIMLGGKFETWLGSIVAPEERFYLTAETEVQLDELIGRTAKIGYEPQIEAAFITELKDISASIFDFESFRHNPCQFTIIDVRNASEVKERKLFTNSINIPLAELRENITKIQTKKPIVVHCEGGYRSAAGSSIIQSLLLDATVYDLGEAVASF